MHGKKKIKNTHTHHWNLHSPQPSCNSSDFPLQKTESVLLPEKQLKWNTAISIPVLYRVGIYSIFWSFVLGPRFKWLKTLRLPLLSKKLLHTFHHCNLIFLWHGNISFLPQSHPVLTLHIINSSTVCCLSSSLRIIVHASRSIYIICQLLSSCHQFKCSPVFLIIS